MSAVLARWRGGAVVGIVAAGVAAGAILVAVPAQAATAKNLVSNGSAETVSRSVPRGWGKGASGSNVHTYSTVTSGAQNGKKFVRTKITKLGSGAAWWMTPAAAVRGGSTYSYSEYYRSKSRTTLNAYFTVRGKVVIRRVADVPASSGWKSTRFSVTAPAGATSVRFGHVLASVGYLDVDNVALVVTRKVSPSTPGTAPKPTSPVSAANSKGLVTFTFDDGWDNQATTAAPILKSAGFPATYYLISGSLGKSDYMTVAQAKALQSSGSEIGSHTVTHANLTTVTPSQLTSELADSKAALEKNFGTITSFAYPYGAANVTVSAATAKYYANARTTNSGLNTRGQYDKYGLTIGYVLNTTSLATVQGWLAEAKANNSWLVLCYHRVANDEPSDAYTTPVSAFQAQVNAVKASGLSVVTMRNGVSLTS